MAQSSIRRGRCATSVRSAVMITEGSNASHWTTTDTWGNETRDIRTYNQSFLYATISCCCGLNLFSKVCGAWLGFKSFISEGEFIPLMCWQVNGDRIVLAVVWPLLSCLHFMLDLWEGTRGMVREVTRTQTKDMLVAQDEDWHRGKISCLSWDVPCKISSRTTSRRMFVVSVTISLTSFEFFTQPQNWCFSSFNSVIQ